MSGRSGLGDLMSMNRSIFAGLVLLALTGCVTKPPTLYQWQGYENSVDEYLRGDKSSPDQQRVQMEDELKKIQSNGYRAPPGFYAHLGLLYGQLGNLDQFVGQVNAEKQLFPESAPYMDFLLRNFKKAEVK
jgi:hypothetical protein